MVSVFFLSCITTVKLNVYKFRLEKSSDPSASHLVYVCIPVLWRRSSNRKLDGVYHYVGYLSCRNAVGLPDYVFCRSVIDMMQDEQVLHVIRRHACG